ARGADPWGENAGIRIDVLEEVIEPVSLQCHEVAALILAEEHGYGIAALELVDRGANAGCHRHLRQRYRESAVGEIMHGGSEAITDQDANKIAGLLFVGEIDRRGRAVPPPEQVTHVDGLTKM